MLYCAYNLPVGMSHAGRREGLGCLCTYRVNNRSVYCNQGRGMQHSGACPVLGPVLHIRAAIWACVPRRRGKGGGRKESPPSALRRHGRSLPASLSRLPPCNPCDGRRQARRTVRTGGETRAERPGLQPLGKLKGLSDTLRLLASGNERSETASMQCYTDCFVAALGSLPYVFVACRVGKQRSTFSTSENRWDGR